jgi:CRISPR/Cas system endoribonuclease Cas6 (RAMP superfamily)
MYSENIMSFLLEESWEWNEFMQSLWDLQHTTNFTPLTDEVKQAMYYHSMGIPDIAVKLFMHVQSKAILNGSDEKITVSLINEVASQSLRLLQPVFEKIRRGGSTSELEDVEPEWGSFNEYIKQAAYRVNIHGKIAEGHTRAIQQRDKETILEELVDFALNLVSNAELAEALAYQVYKASEGMGDKQGMFAQLAQLALENNVQTSTANVKEQDNTLPKLKKTPKTKPLLEEDDMRFIVKQGLKNGLSTEEALEEADLVRDCDELLAFM